MRSVRSSASSKTRRRRAVCATACFLVLLLGCASNPKYTTTRPPFGKGGSQGKIYARGIASYYGSKFHDGKTASGEVYDMNAMTAAHRTLPFGTMVEVENVANGKKVSVKINDRGPFVPGRILDLSREAAVRLGMMVEGTALVNMRIEEWGKTE